MSTGKHPSSRRYPPEVKERGLASRPGLTAKPHEPVWQPNRRLHRLPHKRNDARLKGGATAPERYLRLRGQRSDLVCGQPGGRRCKPKPDHPDRSRDPEGPFQQLDREVTVVSPRDPEDRSELGPIAPVSATATPLRLRARRIQVSRRWRVSEPVDHPLDREPERTGQVV